MRNLFTRFLMIVFLFGIYYQAYAVGSPVAPPLSPPAFLSSLWPEDESDTIAQPGTGNVFTITFSKDLHPTDFFGSMGVFGLVWESQSLGYQQLETILYGTDGATKITKVGPRTVEIRFAANLLEDETYHITIENDAIRFADGTWFEGVDYESTFDPEWGFTVDDITPPQMVECDPADPNNVNGDFNVDIDLDPIVICFDEPVMWAPGADPYKIGNIAFYTAAKSDLDPNTEIGGDVIYANPAHVTYYYNNNAITEKSASVTEIGMFDKVEIYLKDIEKHAEIGSHVWPVDRDIYLRFAAGLLQDAAGNEFAGIDGSPFDPYAIDGSQYWFSTRPNSSINSSAWAVKNTASLTGTSAATNPLFQNDDIVVQINSDDLEFTSDVVITTGNVNQFIKLSIDGSPVSFTVKDIDYNVGNTQFLLEPGNSLPEFKTLKVELLAGIIRNNGDLRVVGAGTWNFNTGDFSAPGITGTINNELCTNFDLRIVTAKNSDNTTETGVVYYAIVKDTLPLAGWPAFPTDIKADEVVKGQVKRTIGGYDYYWHFYHVDDAGVFGPCGVNAKKVSPSSAPAIVGWTADDFNINSTLTAFEHIDDFTNPNHGDNYNIYYFAIDNDCEGPYNNPTGTPEGRATAVTMNDVQLTDCVDPDLTWFYEDDIEDDNQWTSCGQNVLDEVPGTPVPRIKKDGKFELYFNEGSFVEEIRLVEPGLTWEDVVSLEVREYNFGGANQWTYAEIASITEIVEGGKVVGIVVTPLNNYPSRGRARVTLASGSVEDAAGNTINSELICRKNVEIYDDPWVDVFTVENKEQMFPLDEVCPDIDTYLAKKDGKITIEFNNPVYTPKRDNADEPVLLALSLDPAAYNYVGKYVKLREGDATGAEVTDDIALDIPLSFELYDENGDLIVAPNTKGVSKIVATPMANYKSETWYYVELEKELQDENRRELSYTNSLGTWDNNLFEDLHEQYCPYPASAFTGNPPYAVIGNSANYFMRFKAEDTISPELRFVFEKIVENYPSTPNPDDRVWPYIEEVDSASVVCVDYMGHESNGAPVAAIITEWSTMGFDNKDYYINEDPNGLRPYFKLKDAAGNELPFDVVVLNIFTPDAIPVPGYEQYTKDAVWFGFVPFTPLGEGKNFTMEFNPQYQAPVVGQPEVLPVGPVFVDDNGNPLVQNTLVHFTTCSTEPICFDGELAIPTTTIDGKKVAASLTPSFTVDFEIPVDDEAILNYSIGGPFFTLTDGVDTWRSYDATLFYYTGNTVTVPFEAFLAPYPGYTVPAAQLSEKLEYTLTLEAGHFLDRNNEDYDNCEDVIKFWTPDTTAPAIASLSPDIDRLSTGSDVAGTYDPAISIDPRKPGKLVITWAEKVTPQSGKVIELWENGTTKRKTYIWSGSNTSEMIWTAAFNKMELVIPVDFLNYYKVAPNATGHFHVDVKAGFVKDLAGNPSEELTGYKDRLTTPTGDGTLTWTFQTGLNEAPEIVDWSPKCLVEPGNMNTEPVSANEVKINKISVTLTEGVDPVVGKKLYLRRAAGSTDLYVVNVTAMTASADKMTYSVVPSPALIVDNNEEFNIYVEEGAFTETYPLTNKLSSPDYTNLNYLNCSTSGFPNPVSLFASFAFGDISAPTAMIWPVNGNVKVPFNAHGYVKFSEKLIARDGFTPGDPQLILEQGNIKNWIKVLKEDAPGAGTYTALTDAEYVCEFVNLERTHIRVTFLDEDAPAIDGVTANMVDEWKYRIVVQDTAKINGDVYVLQDYMGNLLGMPAGQSSGNWWTSALTFNYTSTFTTEDITVPNFFATTCDVTASTIKIKFTPWENVDPYGNGRNYPAETGTVYYIVKPKGSTAPTAANLFDEAWRTANGASSVNITSGQLVSGVTVTWTAPATVNQASGYNYVVYAVMQDDETDVFAATSSPAFGNAWPVSDVVFVGSGDTDPAYGAIGLADIRPAPNKNMTVRNWNFCYCDDDKPMVVSKEFHQNQNVPVDETFEIKFNEDIQFGVDVIASGEGTGGTIMTPEYGYEVRLREWNNNVAIPISIALNATQDGFIVTPTADLDEETRYYIEIDRWVVWDIANANCGAYSNEGILPQGFPASQCIGCNDDDFEDNTNNFPGWIGRTEWWFQTTDNTPPVLTAVSPLGNCVPVNNNQIKFTFEEKNELLIANLTGQNNNIYVYKVGSQVPYEIISAHSAAPVRGTGNTWTITYTTTHPYNSEEDYYVLWNKALFVDNAIPTKHPYVESLGEVVDYELNAAWHKFGFETEDALKPVVDWSFVNRMWVEEYASEDYIYSLADGSYDSNPEGLGATTDVCAMYQEYGGVPTTVGMYVWFNEPVALTTVTAGSNYNDRWMNANFYLNSASGAVSLQYLGHGVAPVGGKAIPGGETIPEGSQWFYVRPLNGLASLGTYDFGIKASAIKDVIDAGEAITCRTNTLDMINLFDFCTWDETPPTAMLFDGKDVEIEVLVDEADTCVAEREYVRLRFSKPVVKTINVTVPPQFGNPVGTPWWSYSNLTMTEADLKDTDGDDENDIIRFQNMTTGEYVVVTDVDIVTPGVEYVLWLDEPMASENLYEFEIFENKLKDLVRIPNGNFYEGELWDWYVTDWEAPYITGLTPADEEINVSPVTSLEIEFNEDVVLGTDARIIIRDNGQPQGVIYNFRADDSEHVTLLSDDQTVVINHEGLDKNTTYYVQIEPGFVYEENCSNLPFGGKFEQGLIDDTWNFTTGDIDGPVASLWPVPGDGCVEVDADLVITFDENIDLTNNGVVTIYKVREGGSFHNPDWPDAMFGDIVSVIPLTEDNYPQVRISGTDAANGMTENVITITPPAGLWESDAMYYVRVVGNGTSEPTEADVVVDAVGNTWKYPVSHGIGETDPLILLPGIHQNQWYFTIGNNDEPVLVDMTPERGSFVAAGVASAMTDLTMTFEDEVAFGTGAIQVYEFIETPEGGVAAQQAHLWAEFNVPEDVTNGKISLSADMKTVTVHDVALLDGINWYYVLVAPGAITNNIECTFRGWSGISNPDVWLFSTDPDVTIPELTASDVTSDACSDMYEDPSSVMFELTFSEGVSVANGTGLASIYEVGGTVPVATATITPAMIDGGVVTFSISDFNNPLEDQTAYELVIEGDAIHDLATASLAGTQDPFGRVPFDNENWFEGDTIPFATSDFTAPTAVDFMPTAVDLENDVELVVTFDEAVQDGDGMLMLYDAVADTLVASFDAANDEDANDMTVTFATTLPDEMSYYVLIEEGFVTDMLYMATCDEVRGNVAVTDEAAWTFAIDDNTAPYVTEDLTEDADNLMMSFDIVLQYDDVITSVDADLAQLMLGDDAVNGVTSAVIGADPTQVIVSVTVSEDQAEYMLSLEEGFVLDDAINANASLAEMTGPYVVGDRTAPIITDAAPEGILGSYIGVEVMVDFFDDSDLTVKLPITIENSLGEVVATWIPELDTLQADSFMPELWFGTYTVTVPAGAVEDVNGNTNAEFVWSFLISDITPPNCMEIITPADGADCVDSAIDLEMEFCERVAAGDQDMLVKVYDMLEVQGQLQMNDLFYSTPVTEDMIDGEMVKIPVSGLEDNTSYIVMIDADAIRDEAGNPYEGIDDPITWNFTTGDNTAPTVELVPEGSTNNENEFVVNAVFSEPVLGAANIMVENATTSSIAVSATDNKVYVITIEAEDMDTVIITVPVSITDVNCNNNPLAEEVSGMFVIGDNTAPTVSVTDAPANAMNTLNTFTVELTFSEEVKGVEEALAGSVGLDTVVSADNIVYTLTFIGEDETEGSLVLDNTKVTDVSINENVLVEGINWAYKVGDHINPTAVVEPASGNDLRVDTLDLVVTFSEDVVVPTGGIVVTGGNAAVTNVGNVYNVAITALDGAEVELALTSLITDDSENANALAAATYNYTFGDRTAPKVIVYKPSATDTIPTFDVTISFSEKVTGVGTGSVKLTGDGAVLALRTIVDGWAYEATLTGAEKGTIVLAFTDAIKDLAGNALVPAEFTYTIGDFTAPTVVADPATGNFVTNNFNVTLTFDEEVTGVDGAVGISDGSVVVTGSGKVYTVVVTAPSMSDVTLSISDAVKDLAGNALSGVSYTYSVTGVVPIATVQGQGAGSAHVGTDLQVKGTITAVAPGEGIFVQDAVAVWSGIWVEYSNVAGFEVGDGVIVTGEVAEVADVTTIIATAVEAATGTPVITAIKVTPTDAKAEKYESVLTKVEGARADAANAGGEWNIYYQVTDNVMVNDWMYAYTPVKDHFYDVTGIVNGRLDAFKLEPRMASDIVDKTLTEIPQVPTVEFNVYPNPFNDHILIDNNDKLTRVVVVNIAGQRVIDIEYPNREIRTANLVSGVYVISLFTEDGIAKSERIIKR